MDYKSIYLEAFKEKIKEIEAEIISKVKSSKKKNKYFTTLSNNIGKELRDQEIILRSSLTTLYPELFENFLQRFQEYESDHLTSFFTFIFPEFIESYSETALNKCATELGAYEGCKRAANNFSNSTEFLKAIYALDKNYDFYRLDFDPNDNPINSDLFHKMQKERFIGYGQEPNWEEAFLREIIKEKKVENKREKEEEQVEPKTVKPGGAMDITEKRYILHLLYELLSQGSEMKAPEFMQILHLTTDIIDASAQITGNPPHYRQVHEGFSKNYPKNKKIALINRVISKIHGYQLPRLKEILSDKLIALTKIK